MRNIKHCRSSTLNTVNTFGCITYSSSLSTVQVPSILTLSGLPTGRGQTDLESCDSSIYILHIPSQWCHTTILLSLVLLSCLPMETRQTRDQQLLQRCISGKHQFCNTCSNTARTEDWGGEIIFTILISHQPPPTSNDILPLLCRCDIVTITSPLL